MLRRDTSKQGVLNPQPEWMACSWNNRDFRKVNSQLQTVRQKEGALSSGERLRGALSAAGEILLLFSTFFYFWAGVVRGWQDG